MEVFVTEAKKCSKCKRELPLTTEFFHRHKLHPDGFHSECKKCRGCRIKSRKSGFKICSKCGKELPLSAFNKQMAGFLGHRSYCRSCQQLEADEDRFGGNRIKALERDGYRCVLCGSDEYVQVHHKDETGRNKPKEIHNNDLNNLITLCGSCHIKQHPPMLRIRSKECS